MRFIVLSEERVNMLTRIYKYSKYHRVRQRAHCILLSNDGRTIKELKKIFRADLTTIYNWFNAWESESLVGLYDRKGKGRKSVLTSEIKEKIREMIKEYPKKISGICGLIEENFGVSVCVRTVQRFLEASDFRWKRIRLIPEGKPDPEEYEEKKKQLKILKEKEEKGEAELWYYDESGFSLTPCIPYAWQEKGKTLTVESVKSKRLNIAGFMNKNNILTAYISEYNMNSESLIACINNFYENSENRSKKKYIIMDNAPFHRSKLFQEKIKEWKEKNIEIFYLPRYSPHLNLIEILWRFMKYEWIEFGAYKSWKTLVAYVEDVIINFGKKYRINFV
jgi:transposase